MKSTRTTPNPRSALDARTTEIRELESARRKSARAILVYIALLVFAAGVLGLLQRFFTIPIAVTVIVLGMTAFTLIGDIVNYFVCGRRLHRLRLGEQT